MSRVTNAIITAHVGAQGHPDPEIDFVNRVLRESESGGGGEFIEVSRHAGGTKHMECRVYLSAFNHAETKTIIDAVHRIQGMINARSETAATKPAFRHLLKFRRCIISTGGTSFGLTITILWLDPGTSDVQVVSEVLKSLRRQCG